MRLKVESATQGGRIRSASNLKISLDGHELTHVKSFRLDATTGSCMTATIEFLPTDIEVDADVALGGEDPVVHLFKEGTISSGCCAASSFGSASLTTIPKAVTCPQCRALMTPPEVTHRAGPHDSAICGKFGVITGGWQLVTCEDCQRIGLDIPPPSLLDSITNLKCQ